MGKLITKTKLSESVGWSESNGRRWIKAFEGYIPKITKGTSIFYNDKSIEVLKVIKEMSEKGLNQKEIMKFFKEKGVPKNIEKINTQIADSTDIPIARDIMIPFLRIIIDGKAFTSSYIAEELTRYFNLTEEQRNRTYENGKDSIFITRIRQARYSLKKSNYIEEISQSTFQITKEGLDLLKLKFKKKLRKWKKLLTHLK